MMLEARVMPQMELQTLTSGSTGPIGKACLAEVLIELVGLGLGRCCIMMPPCPPVLYLPW